MCFPNSGCVKQSYLGKRQGTLKKTIVDGDIDVNVYDGTGKRKVNGFEVDVRGSVCTSW